MSKILIPELLYIMDFKDFIYFANYFVYGLYATKDRFWKTGMSRKKRSTGSIFPPATFL